jgi:hypothetical protein
MTRWSGFSSRQTLVAHSACASAGHAGCQAARTVGMRSMASCSRWWQDLREPGRLVVDQAERRRYVLARQLQRETALQLQMGERGEVHRTSRALLQARRTFRTLKHGQKCEKGCR